MTNKPAAAKRARHFRKVHGTHRDQDTDAETADEPTRLEHSARCELCLDQEYAD